MSEPFDRKINFLIAGVQKGGTTALHSYLRKNSSIFMPERKELHFFDDETINWDNPDYSSLHEHFKTASLNQIIGEATPIYTFWPKSLKRIASYNKDIKLIICLRDPTERAYSAWSMVTSMQLEKLSFSAAIRDGRDRIKDETAQRLFTYVERGFYAKQIQDALNIFGAKQIFILWQSDLLNHHNLVLDKICRFLETEHVSVEYNFTRPVQLNEELAPIRKEDKDYLDKLYSEDFSKTKELVKYIQNYSES